MRLSPTLSYLSLLHLLVLPLLISCASSGGSEKRVPPSWLGLLTEADSLRIYSLETWYNEALWSRRQLHRIPVLGAISVTDSMVISELASGLYISVRAAMNSEYGLSACFDPRHAIRAFDGGDTIDVMICFECDRIEAYRNDSSLVALRVNDDLCERLNELLTDGNVRLDPRADCSAPAPFIPEPEVPIRSFDED